MSVHFAVLPLHLDGFVALGLALALQGETAFTLIAKGNAPMPEGENANKLTITNASLKEMDDERLGDFPEITFTKPGTYEYTISEDTVTLTGFKVHPGDITATVTAVSYTHLARTRRAPASAAGR